MKYYFTLIGGDYRSSKNKLEEAAKAMARAASYRLIREDKLKSFRRDFIDSIKNLNAMFPRCKPLIAYEESHLFDKNNQAAGVHIDGVCYLSIYRARNEI